MRALALKGQLPQYLDPEFQASINLADLTDAEFRYLRRETLWEAGLTQAAVVGEFGVLVVGPKNNSTRTTLGVIEEVIVQNIAGSATSLRVGLISTANTGSAANAGAGVPRDDRYAGASNQSVFGVGVGSNAVSPTTYTNTSFIRLGVDAIATVKGPWVLTNGVGPTAASQVLMGVWGTEVNKALQAHFIWRERALLTTELS